MHARMLEREIDIAREIQAGFLPAQLPQPGGWELAACFEPARQVGGDFYDAFALDDGRIVVVIADVCDKGVGAALFMALFRSLRSEEHTSELQSLMRISYAVFCLKKKKNTNKAQNSTYLSTSYITSPTSRNKYNVINKYKT